MWNCREDVYKRWYNLNLSFLYPHTTCSLLIPPLLPFSDNPKVLFLQANKETDCETVRVSSRTIKENIKSSLQPGIRHLWICILCTIQHCMYTQTNKQVHIVHRSTHTDSGQLLYREHAELKQRHHWTVTMWPKKMSIFQHRNVAVIYFPTQKKRVCILPLKGLCVTDLSSGAFLAERLLCKNWKDGEIQP